MQRFLNIPNPNQNQHDRLAPRRWTYAALTVIDGERHLVPTHVAFDHLRFSSPPKLQCDQIQILLRNGDDEQQQCAEVLPHEPSATRIPIRLLSA